MNPLEQFLSTLTPEQRTKLKYDWPSHARKNQLPPPGDWYQWVVQAGRGFGKTRIATEMARRWAQEEEPVTIIIAPTAGDLHKVILDGPSGLFAICPPDWQPQINRSTMTVTWPNGSKTLLFSAEEPDRLRGPQCTKLICDELAAWRYPETYDNAVLGLRLGAKPQCIVTTTPRPTAFYKRVLATPGTVVTRGSTYDNRANLSGIFLAMVVARNVGTRRGRQELAGELVENVEGALWQSSRIDELRVKDFPADLEQVVVAVDPAISNTEDSDETGIVVCARGKDGHFYLLEDASGRYDPDAWARRAVALYHRHRADFIVAEMNQGGQLVEATIRAVDPNVSYRGVHASRGKITRAQPIASLTEQGKVHHVGYFAELEEQLTSYNGDGESPDRLDAFVHAMTALSEGGGAFGVLELLKQGWDGFVGSWQSVKQEFRSGYSEAKAVEAPSVLQEQTGCAHPRELVHIVAGGQMHCNQCSAQWWPSGAAPEFARVSRTDLAPYTGKTRMNSAEFQSARRMFGPWKR
jgi:predicted phage terminase large subunit-like protein